MEQAVDRLIGAPPRAGVSRTAYSRPQSSQWNANVEGLGEIKGSGVPSGMVTHPPVA